MKTSFMLVACLALLLGLSVTPAQSALSAADMGKIKGALDKIPAPLDTLKPDDFTLDGKSYTTTVTLLNQAVTIYIYFQDSKPVVAAVFPLELSTKQLIGDFMPAIGLANPVLFWKKEPGSLTRAGMPSGLKKSLEAIGMRSDLTANRLNLYGKLKSGLPVVLPADLFAGIAVDREKKSYTLSASINKDWREPFALADTTMKGGTVLVTREGGKLEAVEAWGTVQVKNKPFTLYYRQEGPLESLGFDAAKLSLDDFFLLLNVASKTLGLPKFPSAGLPLQMVTLENPVYQPYKDASAPLNFTTMLFKGSQEGAKVGEVIAHAKGKVFGQAVAQINLNATGEAVTGDAAVNLALGPLQAGAAAFYLHVSKDIKDHPKMGLSVKKSIFGDLDLAAGTDGLKLAVPAACPLRPIGLSATITDLSLKDFPIKPEMTDCYSAEITKAFNGTVEVASAAGEAVAKGAVTTAKALENEAEQAYKKLHAERIEALGKALVSHAAAKDAVNVASHALSSAEFTVRSLVSEIGKLDHEIAKLAKEIGKLLESAWNYLTGQTKSKKQAEKKKKQEERRKKQVAHASAVQKVAQAKAALEKAKAQPTEIPGPNLDAEVMAKDHAMLGELAQQDVQAQMAVYAAEELVSKLKDVNERKKMLQAVDIEDFKADHAAGLSEAFPTLSALYTKQKDGKVPMEQLLDQAKNDLLERAVLIDIEEKAREIHRDTVAALPTMAFDLPVNLVFGEGNAARCLEAPTRFNVVIPTSQLKLAVCNGSPRQVFVFTAAGKLKSGSSCLVAVKGAGITGDGLLLNKDCAQPIRSDQHGMTGMGMQKAENFFIDPIGGIFSTYFPKYDGSTTVTYITATSDGELGFSRDPKKPFALRTIWRRTTVSASEDSQWHVVPADKTVRAAQMSAFQKMIGKTMSQTRRAALKERLPVSNVAPLQLDETLEGRVPKR